MSAPVAVIIMCFMMCFLGASFSTSQYITLCYTLMYDFLEDAERNATGHSRPFMSKELQDIFDKFGYIYSGVPPRDSKEITRIINSPSSALGVVHNCNRTELMRYSYVGQINDPNWSVFMCGFWILHINCPSFLCNVIALSSNAYRRFLLA